MGMGRLFAWVWVGYGHGVGMGVGVGVGMGMGMGMCMIRILVKGQHAFVSAERTAEFNRAIIQLIAN